jgi:hypothetical protein
MAINRITDRLFHTEFGCMIISGVFGLGLAFIFSNVCKGKNCVVITSPDLNDIKGKIFQIQDECYTYTPKIVSCDVSNSTPSIQHIKN